MKKINISITFLLFTTFFYSCSDEETGYQDLPLGNYDQGVLVLNEGNFGTDNSTLSFISNDFQTFQQDAFQAINSETMGNTGQSITFYNDLGYAIVNGSNKIIVFNRYTLEKQATISTGLNNPRFMTVVNGKGYVTNWGSGSNANDDYVAVFNLSSYTLETTVAVNEGPEKLISLEDKIYIAHKGGFGFGNKVSVLECATNTIISSITVGDVPNSLFIKNDVLFVLCEGKPSWSGTETSGSLHKITLSNLTQNVLYFAQNEHPNHLVLHNEDLYFTMDASIYKMNANASSLPSTSLFNLNSQGVYGIYGFAVSNNHIYIGDAKDFNSNGSVYVYSTDGLLKHEYTVRVSPNGFYFN